MVTLYEATFRSCSLSQSMWREEGDWVSHPWRRDIEESRREVGVVTPSCC